MDVLLDYLPYIAAVAALALVVFALRGLSARRRALEQLYSDESGSDGTTAQGSPTNEGLLRRWLFLAGFRGPGSTPIFSTAASAAFVAAATLGFALEQSSILTTFEGYLYEVPGGIGDLFLPGILLAPWIVFFIVASIPWLHIRSARRSIVSEIEEDLPVVAELFATLGEAGLGFDSTVERVVASESSDRALVRELQLYRLDLLAGVSRIDALRNIAHRLEVAHVSTIVSALVQAEQVGAGLSGILRQQADDLRQRRRERAMRLAQGLPVKLTFPLVVCFFPAIVVGVLGPSFHQIFQMIDSYIGK